MAARVAAFYERIRGIIDWREEHLLKIVSIERALKRRLLPKISNGNDENDIAEPLVLELIRGGHFPNDKMPESKIQEVRKTIDNYLYIINNRSSESRIPKIQIYNWLSAIAACEIEEILSPSLKERALLLFAFESMKAKIKIEESVLKATRLTPEEKDIQVFIAVHKALFKMDTAMITYHLLKYLFPDWKNPSQDRLSKLAFEIDTIKEHIESYLNHPLAEKFYQICERHDTIYLLIGDAVAENPSEAKEKMTNPENLELIGSY